MMCSTCTAHTSYVYVDPKFVYCKFLNQYTRGTRTCKKRVIFKMLSLEASSERTLFDNLRLQQDKGNTFHGWEQTGNERVRGTRFTAWRIFEDSLWFLLVERQRKRKNRERLGLRQQTQSDRENGRPSLEMNAKLVTTIAAIVVQVRT